MKLSWIDGALVAGVVFALFMVMGGTAIAAWGIFTQNTYRQDPVSGNVAATGGDFKAECGLKLVPEYLPYIKGASQKYGISQAVIAAVILQESGWDPGAKSNVGAGGLMQIMPDTYASIRGGGTPTKDAQGKPLDPNTDVDGAPLTDERLDPKTNIYYGTHYLHHIYFELKKGSWPVTFASYNSGPNNKYTAAGQIPPYKQTVEYVKAIAGSVTKAGYMTLYAACLDTTGTNSTGDLKGIHPAVQKLIDYVKSDRGRACQFDTGGVGDPNTACARTVIKTLNAVYSIPGDTGNKLNGTPPACCTFSTAPPSAAELSQAKSILAQGDIPVWHINGHGSGQHWIALVHIDENNTISYYDPESGTIESTPYNQQTTLKNGTPVSYFGMTWKDPGGGRGYHFPVPQRFK